MRAETSATSAVATLSVAVAVVGHVLVGGSASVAAVPQLVVLGAIAWSLGEHLTGRRWLTVAGLAALQLVTHLTLDASHRPVVAPAAAPHPAMDAASMGHSSAHEMTAMDHAAMGHTGVNHAAMGHAGVDHAAMGHAGMATPMPEPLAGAAPAAAEPAASMHGGFADAVSMSAAHLFVLLAGVLLIGSTHRWVQRVLRILSRLVPQLPAAAVTIPGVRAALPGVPEQPRLTQRWLTSSVSRRGPPAYGVLAAL
ncbi:hypothetical protein AB0P21_21040 [Kribbella sp. NPDC056861]|uniref:hypothetical protein n=1 Tax=Kribbella sp. NPDC056861 TaxID=3154857 RepID=UPI00344841D2